MEPGTDLARMGTAWVGTVWMGTVWVGVMTAGVALLPPAAQHR